MSISKFKKEIKIKIWHLFQAHVRSGEGGLVPVGAGVGATVVGRVVVFGMRLVAGIVDGQSGISELLRSGESAAFHLD